MFGWRIGVLAVGFCCRAVIHMVAKQIAQSNWFGMVMIRAPLLLMAKARIKCDAFIHKRIAVPEAITASNPGARVGVAAILIRLGKTVAGVKHLHAVHNQSNLTEMIEMSSRLRDGMSGNGDDEMLVGWQVGKQDAPL